MKQLDKASEGFLERAAAPGGRRGHWGSVFLTAFQVQPGTGYSVPRPKEAEFGGCPAGAGCASTCFAAVGAGWWLGGQARPTWDPAPPAQSPPGGRARSQSSRGEVRKGGGPGRGLRLSEEPSARPRLWLGPLAGVTALLAMRTLWMVLCALARLWPGALAGCAEVGRCCPGRDPACFARGWRLDRVYGTCFCDQACRLTGDCCFDYDRACPGGLLGPGRDC